MSHICHSTGGCEGGGAQYMTLGVHTTTDRGAIFSRGDVNGVPPDISHGIHHRIVYNRRYEGMGGGLPDMTQGV